MRSKITKKFTALVLCLSIIMSTMLLINANSYALSRPEMIEKINTKYLQNLWLGTPTTNCQYLSAGAFRCYPNGSIFIGNNVGAAYIINGEVGNKWASLGCETGFLGYPTTDVSITTDGIGKYSHFEGGSIYWHPAIGAHEVHGLIHGKWASLGWENSLLGYPLSDELTLSDGVGKYSQFQGGRIYYHPSYGTHYVTGKMYLQWADAGAEKSSYGYPVSDPQEVVINNAVYILQNFANGYIMIAKNAISPKIDLRKEIARRGIEIDNQGSSRGTCSVFAMTFLLEYQLTGLFGDNFNNLSQEYLNHMANKATGRTDDGDFFWAIESGYFNYGIIPNSMLPYDPNLIYDYNTMDSRITKSMTDFGSLTLRNGIRLNGRFIKRVDELVGLTDSQFNEVISSLNNLTPVAIGRSHSMVIVGYEYDSSYPGGGYFVFRNSYGPGSGDNGYLIQDFAKVKAETNDAYVFQK